MPHRATVRPIAAMALAVLLASCAAPPNKTLSKYVAPASGPTSKLVMRGSVLAGDIYAVNVLDNTDTCTGRRIVGTGAPGRNPVSTTLVSNQIATVEFLLVKPNKTYCSVLWSFTPAAGKSYLLSGVALPTGCVARVMDMSDPENLKPEAAALRRNLGAESCTPLSRSKAASVADTERGGADAVLRPGAKDDDLQGLIGK